MSAAGAALLAALLLATIAPAMAREAAPAHRPLPQPPATSAAPTPQPPAGSAPSPRLLQHGPATPPPRSGATPSYPSPSSPAPIDQQKLQSYRSELLNERRRLENRGVSPGSERYREIQQQLDLLDRQR